MSVESLVIPSSPAQLPGVPFSAPLVNPAPNGLYPLVDWQDDANGGPSRFLGEGVWIRHYNYGGAGAFGVWDAPWCGKVERVTVSGIGGTWTYSINGVATSAQTFNVAPSALQTAINGLSGVVAGEHQVSQPSPGVYLISHTDDTTVTAVDGDSLTGPNAGAKTLPVIKTGDRPADTDPFPPMTVWAYGQCDMTDYGQTEADTRAKQNLRLLEPIAAERDFAIRLLADSADVVVERASLASGIAYLEGVIGETGTLGVIHANAEWATIGRSQQLWSPSTATIKTVLGHTMAFGGGYVDGLGTTLVATSAPIFGWRDDVQFRSTLHPQTNEYLAVAERSVALGYEEIIGAVTVTTAP